MQFPQLALTVEDIASATQNDTELKMLHKNILLDSNKCGSNQIRDGCVLFGTWVWILKNL